MNAPARAHAVLSASGSQKWLNCTRSARFESTFPDQTSEFSAEGQFAHALGELKLRFFLGEYIEHEYQDKLARLRSNRYWNADLEQYVGHYVDFAVARIQHARQINPDAVILIEKRLDFSPWVPQGFGTGDLVIVVDDVVEVVDLKFGKGLRVNATANPQLQLYALGAVHGFGHLFDIQHARMTIVQPRLEHISTYEMPLPELLQWADEIVAPRAQLAWHGEGDFVAGKHCTSGFCRARFQCPTREQEANVRAAASFAFMPLATTHAGDDPSSERTTAVPSEIPSTVAKPVA